MARYLSRAELSCIAGKYIEMYYALFGISKNDPAPINPEQFANSVLGLNLKMLPLCSDFPVILTNTGALHPEYGLFAPSNGPLPQGNV